LRSLATYGEIMNIEIMEFIVKTLELFGLFYCIPFVVSRGISDGLGLNKVKTIINVHRDLENKQ
jgi:hypothetical protein